MRKRRPQVGEPPRGGYAAILAHFVRLEEINMCPWIDVPRENYETVAGQPYVTLRTSAIAFNAPFVRMGDLKQHRFVSFKVDPAAFKIAMRFHSDENDPYALTLGNDGGGGGHKRRERNNLSVQAVALIRRNAWVLAAARADEPALRRFRPEWNSLDRLWVITLRPAFENHAKQIDEIPSDAAGIYRYVRDEKIIYIGKGQIRSRAQAPERSDWDWDRIEYSLIDQESEQFKWESWWLNWFEGKHGRLPHHNRIGGQGA
jgi:hypothetical protein